MPTTSYWNDSWQAPAFPPLAQDLVVDVAVIGGGITGVTAAYLLKREGLSVALLERHRCAAVDTGHTTAHLTQVTDTRLDKLVSAFGRDHAQAAWDAGAAAIDQIEAIVSSEGIDCHFSRVPAFLHASIVEDRNERDILRADAEHASAMGFHAEYLNAVPLFERPGVSFANQARFHPLRYISGLLERIPGGDCHVFEQTEVTEFADDGLSLVANGHKVLYKYVVVATDVPLAGKLNVASATLFQSKITPYTSYAVGGKVTAGQVPDALFWDTSEPYFYLRLEQLDGHDYVIFGGADHKTGQSDDPAASFAHLQDVLSRFVPGVEVDHRWSGQVVETHDGLPFIGEIADKQFVATGFGGNGMTFGTLAAMMARDAVTVRRNPWRQLFDPHRKTIAGLWDYVRENKDYPYYMVKDRMMRGEATSLDRLARGEGGILRLDGELVAAYRDDAGRVTRLSPVCTHMGCIVHWNGAERTWDCPCHGSRFEATGEVLGGPAESPLRPIESAQPQKTAASSRR